MPERPDVAPGEAAEAAEESLAFAPRFDADGLIPAIAVDARNADVLMLAWMDREALRLTLETGFVHYFSRSRRKIWKKGATSGALQRVVEVLTDCDQDTILVRAEVAERAGTCHTGRTTCFYRRVTLGPGGLSRRLAFTSGEGGEP